MSDKNKIPLVDQGWSQMASALDTELPQTRKKRRPMFWLFFAGVMLLGISYSVNYIIKDRVMLIDNQSVIDSRSKMLSSDLSTENKIQLEDEKAIKVVTNAAKSNRKSDIVIVDNKASKSISKQINGNPDAINSIRVDATAPSKRLKTETIKRTTSVVKSDLESSNAKADNKEKTNKESNISRSSTDKTQFLNPFIEVKVNEKEVKIDGINTSAELLLGETNGLVKVTALDFVKEGSILSYKRNFDFSEIVDHLVRPLEIEQVKNHSFKNYAFVGGVYDTSPSGIGFQVGLGRKVDVGSFKLFGEIGYTNIKYNSLDGDLEEVTLDFDVPEVTNVFTDFDTEEVAVLKNSINEDRIASNTLISNLDYIFLKLGIEKTIYKKLSLIGGVSIARFLNIENRGIEFRSNVAEYQPQLDNYGVSNSVYFENGRFSKYELSTSIGLNYRLTRRINLSSDFRFGLTNLFRSIEEANASDLGVGFPLIPTGEARFIQPSIIRSGIELNISYSF